MSDESVAPPPLRPLLTLGDFFRVVPISRPVLERLVEKGQLKAVRIGSKLYFRPEDVEAFLRTCSE